MYTICVAETTPQDIATILINEWDPIAKEHGIDIQSVPPWIIRQCIDQYTSGNVNRNGLRTLFHHYAERAIDIQHRFIQKLLELGREAKENQE